VAGITSDKVLHVHPSTQTSPSKEDGGLLAGDGIDLDNIGARYLEMLGSDGGGHAGRSVEFVRLRTYTLTGS
jgi:hypothetical protein